jgi:hypothetical protein
LNGEVDHMVLMIGCANPDEVEIREARRRKNQFILC